MSLNRSQMLYDLGELLVEKKLVDANPCGNTGATFSCDVFSLNSYCWCEGESPEHQDGCDDGFSFSADYLAKLPAYSASWYKHVHRGFTDSGIVSDDEFFEIVHRCRKFINEMGT